MIKSLKYDQKNPAAGLPRRPSMRPWGDVVLTGTRSHRGVNAKEPKVRGSDQRGVEDSPW